MVSVNIKTVSVDITFARFPPHMFGLMPTTNKTTPPGRSSPDQAKEQTDAARRRARQSIREHELIWLLQQRLRAVSWPQWRLRSMLQPHCTATAWELSDLDHSHAATPQRATRASCAQLQLLRSDLAPPAVDLLEALGRCVCTRRACCFCLCVYRTSAASVELRPRGWRAVAFPCWHHYESASTWLIVILMVRCCFGGLSHYKTNSRIIRRIFRFGLVVEYTRIIRSTT